MRFIETPANFKTESAGLTGSLVESVNSRGREDGARGVLHGPGAARKAVLDGVPASVKAPPAARRAPTNR